MIEISIIIRNSKPYGRCGFRFIPPTLMRRVPRSWRSGITVLRCRRTTARCTYRYTIIQHKRFERVEKTSKNALCFGNEKKTVMTFSSFDTRVEGDRFIALWKRRYRRVRSTKINCAGVVYGQSDDRLRSRPCAIL